METCMPESDNFAYMMLGLVEEVGEFAGKVAKAIRKGQAEIGAPYSANDLTLFCIRQDSGDLDQQKMDELTGLMKKEAGDILWMLSGLCVQMGWTLEDVAQCNLNKLAARKEAGTIVGEGDGIHR